VVRATKGRRFDLRGSLWQDSARCYRTHPRYETDLRPAHSRSGHPRGDLSGPGSGRGGPRAEPGPRSRGNAQEPLRDNARGPGASTGGEGHPRLPGHLQGELLLHLRSPIRQRSAPRWGQGRRLLHGQLDHVRTAGRRIAVRVHPFPDDRLRADAPRAQRRLGSRQGPPGRRSARRNTRDVDHGHSRGNDEGHLRDHGFPHHDPA
jgi:hypothetical protein